MSSQLYIGNGQATPSIVVEKLVPVSASNCIQKDLDDGKIINGSSVVELENAHDVGDFAFHRSYCLNPNISGNIDLSQLTDISGTYGCAEMFSALIENRNSYPRESYSITSHITSVDLSGLTTISGNYACSYMFYKCTNLKSFNISSLATVYGTFSCQYMFSGCTGITGALDLSSLVHIHDNSGCQYMFQGCTGITSVDLSGLTTIGDPEREPLYDGGKACYGMFSGCTSLVSADLSGLTHICHGQQNMNNMFSGCTNLVSVNLSNLTALRGYQHFYSFIANTKVESVTFNKLNNLGEQSGLYGFGYNATNLKHLYFPALTTNSFNGDTGHFNNMVYGVTGCTLHFPSNLSSIIPTMTKYASYPNFGGTNTVILYDLPATE